MSNTPKYMSLAQKRAQENYEPPVRIVMAGRRGTGKTGSVADAANCGFKVFYFDLNGENYASVIERLDKKGEENFIPISFYNERDVKGKIAKSATILIQFENTLSELKEAGEFDHKNTIVFIDGLSDIGRSLLDVNEARTNAGALDRRVSVLDSWNYFSKTLDLILSSTRKCILMMAAHLTDIEMKDEPVRVGFDFISKSYGLSLPHLPGLCDLYVLEKTIAKEGVSIKVLTKETNRHPFIKCSSGLTIPNNQELENFIPKAINAIRNKEWAMPEIKE